MTLTFEQMERKFGPLAGEYLHQIEIAAGIVPSLLIDPETRLLNALSAQDQALAARAA